jgi:ribonuclease VapC
LIVVDSSAVVAILLTEPDARELIRQIDADAVPHISAASVLESSIVLRAKSDMAPAQIEEWIDGFFADGNFTIEPVTLDQLAIARRAHMTYGKGTGHPAQLNFGDCFSYALAKSLNAPLLYKGGDFGKTDIVSALR